MIKTYKHIFSDTISLLGALPFLLAALFSFSVGADNYSSCHIAKTGSAEEVSAVLLEQNDINLQDRMGKTLLHCAAFYNNDPAVISLLLSAGANPHLEDNDGWSPLELAAYYNNSAVVKAFIEGGANPNSIDKAGDSPIMPGGRNALHFAAENNNDPEVISLLLSAGTNPHIEDEDGWSPLALAFVYNTFEIRDALIIGGENHKK